MELVVVENTDYTQELETNIKDYSESLGLNKYTIKDVGGSTTISMDGLSSERFIFLSGAINAICYFNNVSSTMFCDVNN